MLRLLLVEDHAMFRATRVFLLNRVSDLEVVAECGSLAGCRSLKRLGDIDVALLDLGLPDGDGTGLIRDLREVNPHIKVLILTASPEADLEERMAQSGADGLLDKMASSAEIAAEVRRVATSGR